MNRKKFIQTASLFAFAPIAMKLTSFKNITDRFSASDKMPVLFIGHGNPMNAIEDNSFTRNWKNLGDKLPAPNAILCISAHWLTKGSYVTAMESPRTIHDFYGFPEELFEVQYNAPGAPAHAKETLRMIKSAEVKPDSAWGLDHGTWSVLKPMFPKADIPVFQLSIDINKPPAFHYALGKELSELRQKGVLIIGSGNIVHNLRLADFSPNPIPYDWAVDFDEKIKNLLVKNDHASIINYSELGRAAKLSVPTPDHYYPLLYTLGLQEKGEPLKFPVEGMAFGSGSMRSVRIG